MHENSLHLPSVTFGFVFGISVSMMIFSLFVENAIIWVIGFLLMILIVNHMMDRFENDAT